MALSEYVSDLKTRKTNLDALAKTFKGDKVKENILSDVADAIKVLEPLSKQYDTLSKQLDEAKKASGGPTGPDALDQNIDTAIKALQSTKTTLKKDTFYIKKHLETVESMIQDLVKQATPIAEHAKSAGDLVGNVKKYNDDLKKAGDKFKDLSKNANSLRGASDTKKKDFSGIMNDIDHIHMFKLEEPS